MPHEQPLMEATLVHGATYTVGNTKFEYGIPRTVEQPVADYLQEHAVYSAKITNGGKVSRHTLQKFEFTMLDEEGLDPDADAEDEAEDKVAKAATKPKTTKAKATKPAARPKRRQRGTTTKE